MNLWTKFKNSKHFLEVYRSLPLIVIASLILVPDTGSQVVLYALGIIFIVSVASHIVRKILFPYIDLGDYSEKALETPLSASIVFLSVSILLGVIIASTCMLLH